MHRTANAFRRHGQQPVPVPATTPSPPTRAPRRPVTKAFSAAAALTLTAGLHGAAGASPASAASSYEVKTPSGMSVNVRTGPGTSHYSVVGSVESGSRVNILCTGYDDDGNLWNKIGPGEWVVDEYVKTFTDNPVAASCEGSRQWGKEQQAIDRSNGSGRPSPAACRTGVGDDDAVEAILTGSCWPSPVVGSPGRAKLTLPNGDTVVGLVEPGAKTLCSAPLPNPDREDGYVSFRVACAMHDYAYQLIREGVLTRSGESRQDAKFAADNIFYQALNKSCSVQQGILKKLRCYDWALEYRAAVGAFGELFL